MKTLNQLIDQANEFYDTEVKRSQERLEKQRQKTIEGIESVRMLTPELLEVVGDKLDINSWDGSGATIRLGEKPSSRQRQKLEEFKRCLVQLRNILGNLKETGKDVQDAQRRTVRVELTSSLYPSIRIVYYCKLPRGAKCKIERSHYHTLVCR